MLLKPLFDNATNYPNEIAIVDDLGEYTFQRLMQTAYALGGILKEKTDRPTVGILLPSGAGFVAGFYGSLLAGKVPVPINFLLGPREIGHIIQDAGFDTILTISLLGDRIKDIPCQKIDLMEFAKTPPGPFAQYSPPEYQPDDLATILYTSGTSGLPKGVCLTHGNLHHDVHACIQHARLTEKHRFLGIVPLFHSTGMLATFIAPMTLAAKVVYTARFSPVITIQKIREHSISVMAGVPSMYAALLRLKEAGPEDFSSMFAPISGGEPLPAKVREAFEQRFGTRLIEGYGLTETIGPVAFNTPHEYRAGSVGKPIPGAEIRIVDDNDHPLPLGQTGEVLIRGPMVFKSYQNLPHETVNAKTADGFFRSGDLGRLDDDGFLYITGRKKDLIIVSGEKVYPREIEELLSLHPDISEVAVIGRPDQSRGEAVVAFVVPKEGHSVTTQSVRAFLREQGVVNWKQPKEVFQVSDLPRSPTGKVLKRELQHRLGPT
ncbi:MAG: long-chain-fatty-acid--CoA ligase [Phycisphaerae bacterium]|jgi:long-chain acyl-CoA synthetase|nr:MAG: long-chain-fatty-acid--CoA ligase [Phycisphaerae bacterium]